MPLPIDPTPEQNRRMLRYLDPIERARVGRISARINAAREQAAMSDALRTLTPAQAVDWIETNVKDLASAKTEAGGQCVVQLLASLLETCPRHTEEGGDQVRGDRRLKACPKT